MKTLVNILKIIIFYILLTVLVVGIGYIAFGHYYKDGFSYGTYINGVYCTGKTVDEVNEIFTKDSGNKTVSLNVGDEKYTFELSDVGFTKDYKKPLQSYINSQNPYLWIENMNKSAQNRTMEPEIYLDELALSKIIDDFKLKDLGSPHAVYLKLTETEGYTLINGKTNMVDTDRLKAFVMEALYSEATEIIADESCYKEATYSEYEKGIMELYKEIEAFQNMRIIYRILGKDIPLSKTEVVGLLSLDATGKPYMDEKGVLYFDEESVLNGLTAGLNPYNTYHNYTFTTHDGRKVYINDGTYGTEFSIKDEADKLFDALNSGKKFYKSEPVLKRKANFPGPNDIGDTYLEISLDEQRLYYWQDGKMVLESDVVTGNHARKYDTPEGVDYVYFKQRNRTLVGEDYRSFVKYWIAFIRRIGVHDAGWRDEFGGDIYLRAGSHGCVNTPEENVSKLYEMIEVGTPVIVYSYNNSLIQE